MKTIACILSTLILLTVQVEAQTRYKVSEPEVSFFAGTPLEDIDANSDKLVGVIDTETNSFAFRIAMNSFQFKRELMQEHYNENYLETDKYPNAEFKGAIEGDFDLTTDGEYHVKAKGTFTVHNVEKEYEITAVLSVKSGVTSLEATFPIVLEDHDIDRPSIVLMKIAEKADITVKAKLIKLS